MKIMYISNEATLGGAAQSLLNMIKALKDKRIDIVIILPENGIIEKPLKELGIKYYIVPFTLGYSLIGTASVAKANADFISNYSSALCLQEIIQKEQIDLIHINSSTSNVGAFAAMMAGIPYVWHIRELLEELYASEFWDKDLKKRLLHQADAVVAISKTVSEVYKRKFDVDTKWIYNGIDIVKYKEEICERIVPDDMHRFIITGIIFPGKGQKDAVDAVELLVKEGIKNIHLTLIGHGGFRYRWYLKEYIKQRELDEYVSILPFQDDLKEYRRKCQYSLTTTNMEALGRCTIEAMLAGQFVIGADNGGTKELIGEEETKGLLYQQGNAQSLACAMKRAMDKSEEEKMYCRINAQKYAEETFAPELYADKIYELYTKVLAGYRKESSERSSFIEELRNRYESCADSITVESTKSSKPSDALNRWLDIKDKSEHLKNICKEQKIRSVAIYGAGNMGVCLYDELTEAGVQVSCFIDRNPDYMAEVTKVIGPEAVPENVDAVIISVLAEEEKLILQYKERVACKVIGVSELMDEME